VLCLCNNPEFLDHDEYVYSVRKALNYDYNEKYFILLPGASTIHLKVALKVPNYYKRI
jgi:predicted RNA methylase